MCFVVRQRWRPLKPRFFVHKSWFSSFLSAHMYCGNFWRLETTWLKLLLMHIYFLAKKWRGKPCFAFFFSPDIGFKIIPLLFLKKNSSNTLCILIFVWFLRFTWSFGHLARAYSVSVFYSCKALSDVSLNWTLTQSTMGWNWF